MQSYRGQGDVRSTASTAEASSDFPGIQRYMRLA